MVLTLQSFIQMIYDYLISERFVPKKYLGNKTNVEYQGEEGRGIN